MNVDIKVLCSECKECKRFEVLQQTMTNDDGSYELILCCKHLDMCRNAVKVWKKRNDNNISMLDIN